MLARAKVVLRSGVFGDRTKAVEGLQIVRSRLLHAESVVDYDTELLSRGEINDRALVGLKGVVKVGHAIVKGMSYLNFEAFAPATQWKDLSPLAADERPGSEVA